MSDKPYCPWCGRNMDELENGKIDGHTWYRDDSFYIKDLERTRRFLEERVAGLTERGTQLEQLCRDLYHAAWKHRCFAPDEDNSGSCINPEQDCEHCQWWKPAFERRMEDLGLLEADE